MISQTILIVDDDRDTRQMIELILVDAGCGRRILQAASGQEALKVVADEHPDLVLLDITMPQMDGLQVYEKIKAVPGRFQPAVFFLTARVGRDDVMRGFEMGADDYIEKPFDPQLLAQKVRNRLAKVEAMKRAVLLDPLTGLYTRSFFQEQLALEFKAAKRYGKIFSVLFIDLDDFKKVNDNYGHQTGDLFLKEAARLFQDFFRQSDIVARYAGDEFCVFLPEATPDQSRECVRRLYDRVAHSFVEFGAQRLPLGMSIGRATFESAVESEKDILKMADSDMYAEKARRRKGR